MSLGCGDPRFAQSASDLLGREMLRSTLLLEGKAALEGKVRTEVEVRLSAAGPPQELPPLKLVQKESKAATTTAPIPV